MRDGLVGSALHIIQDSFAQGHVWRNELGEIKMFQTYEGQGDKHAEMDHSSINDPVAFQRSVGASAAYLTLIKNEVSVQQVINYLNTSFFPLAKDVQESGVAPGFEKKPKNSKQGFEL